MSLFDKFKIGLGKSSSGLSGGFKNIFSKKKLDNTVLDEFEELIDLGLDWLTISFDGIGETYNKIRAPLTFEDAVNGDGALLLYQTHGTVTSPSSLIISSSMTICLFPPEIPSPDNPSSCVPLQSPNVNL